MAAYKKTEAALAKLSPEEYRVTQQSATELLEPVRFSTTTNRAFMSI